MKTSVQILPGVKALAWLDCRTLPARVDLHGITRSEIYITSDLHSVNFFDTPVCSCTTERDNAGFKDTASLKFKSAEQLPYDIPVGFVVTDIDGNNFLIGAREHPRPIVKREARCGSPDNDSAGFEYDISHIAIKSMIKCRI